MSGTRQIIMRVLGRSGHAFLAPPGDRNTRTVVPARLVPLHVPPEFTSLKRRQGG